MSAPGQVTVVMYHYVRDPDTSRYPAIRGLLPSAFEGQLDHLARHHTIIDPLDLLAARDASQLPPAPCVLTFDDGLRDHHRTVLPILADRGLRAAFFPSARPLTASLLLPVHRVHFVMAAASDSSTVIAALRRLLAELRERYTIPADDELWRRHAHAFRHDEPEVIFVKRVLQRDLPLEAREEISRRLFREFVSTDEAAFAHELYMGRGHLRELVQAGMVVGGHGVRHEWLGSLEPDEQRAEIEGTRRFLASILGEQPTDWVMCYPYGSYDDVTLRLLRENGCGLAFRTGFDLADLERPLELKRLDTREFPTRRDAPPCAWSLAACRSRAAGGSPEP